MKKVEELIANKQFAKARADLAKIVADDNKNIDALKLLGLCHVNLGLFKEGQSNFETVVKFRPEDASSWFYLANCYDNQEQVINAVAAYQEVIRLSEKYIDAYKNLCVIYMRSNQAEKAAELGVKALELTGDDYTLFYIVGTAYMSLKNFEGSVLYLEKALQLQPEHSQLYNNLGTCYITIGNLDKAYENFVKASEYDPENSITYFNIASILQIQNKHKEAIGLFQKAYELEQQDSYLVAMALSEVKIKDFDSAIRHYKTLIAHNPEKHNYQYNLACCYEAIGAHQYAIGILAHLVMLNPKSVSMSQKLADIYMKVNQPLHARELYEKIIMQGNVSPDLYYEFAHICVKTGDLDKAEQILKKVISLNMDFAPAHKDLGVIYLNKRLFDYAKDEFEQAYKLAPDDFFILFEYANFLHATADFKKADKFYKKALAIIPDDKDALGFSALNKIHLKEFDTALEQVEEAIVKAHDEPFLYFIAGKVCYLKGDYEMAKLYLIRAYEMDATNDVKNLLAMTYFELEDYEHANNIFKSLLEASPMNVNLLLNTAKCYDKLSDTASALEYLDKAVEIFPECEEAHEMIRRLS